MLKNISGYRKEKGAIASVSQTTCWYYFVEGRGIPLLLRKFEVSLNGMMLTNQYFRNFPVRLSKSEVGYSLS